MTQSLQLFEYSGHQVRTVLIDNEPAFVAADICAVLELSNPRTSLALLDDDEKGVHTMDTPGGPQEVSVVNEPGMYSLVLRSRKPEAKQFKRWITHDVLPEIRKTGSYGSPAELTRSDLARMVIESEEEKAALTAELTEVTPKAEAYDTFMDADGTYSVGTVAKMLGLSQNKLFQELRNRRVLISKGPMRNTPYQQYMHHFGVKAHNYTRSDGSESTSYTTRVQASGVDFIRRKLGVDKKVAA